jgi:hypothetical protein
MTRTQIQSIIEQLTNWTLIISGALGSVLGIVDLVINSQTDFFKSLTLLLLGLIALGLGLERLLTYKKLEKTLESLAGGIRLESWDEIYGAAAQLAQSAQSQIRATAFGQGKWAGPSSYLKLITQIAKSREQSHGTFLYKVTFGYDEKPDADRAKHILERLDTFREQKVSHMLKLKHLDTKWVVDFLIIDDHSLIIAFPQFTRQALRVGLKFVNQPKLVKPIADWYDEQIWAKASDVDIDEIQKIANGD